MLAKPRYLEIFPRKTILAALVGANLLYALVAYSGVLVDRQSYWWTDGAWTLMSLLAAVKALHTASLVKEVQEKIAWRLFGLAAFVWFVGMLIWDNLELLRNVTTPYPSVADYFYLLFAPIFIAGTLYYRSEFRARYITLVQIGNIGVIVCTVMIIVLTALYEHILRSSESGFYIAFAIGYAVVYMTAFVFALYCYWFYVWGQNKQVFLSLLIALAIHAGSDLLYAAQVLGKTYEVVNYINYFWVAAFSFQIWGAVEQDSLLAVDNVAISATVQSDSHLFEGVVPAVAIISIILTFMAFSSHITATLLEVAAYIGLMLGLFLTLREWWLSRALHEATDNLKAQVHERTRKLTEANAQLESYSYSIAHDLRAPLRSVISFSQILQQDTQSKLTEDEQDSLRRIIQSGKFMAELIDDILELSRLTGANIVRERVNVSDRAYRLVQRIRAQGRYLHGKISIEPGIIAEADPRWIDMLLDNLLRNAFKFTQHTSDAKIAFGQQKVKGHSMLYVRDNGAGFDMRYVDKLFKPFHRLHSATEYKGTGIGLAIVKRIVDQHGGEVWGEGEVGSGACFYFRLTER